MRTIVLAVTLTFSLQAGAQILSARTTDARTASTPAPTNTVPAAPTANLPKTATPFTLVLVSQPTRTIAPAPYEQNPIHRLRGSARAILIFAPDPTDPALLRQLALLERNELFLSVRDVILVPNIAQHQTPGDVFPGENISPGTEGDQLAARLKFGIKPADFAIIVLDKDGTEKLRSATPVNVASIGAHIDGVPDPAL